MSLHLNQVSAGLVVSMLVAMIAGPTVAQGEENDQAEATAAEVVLDQFSQALNQGNGNRALELLSEHAVILESGIAQTRSEYADHHLGSDMSFLANLKQSQLSRQILHAGDAVVIISRTQLSGHYDDQEIDIVSAETAVLVQANGKWKIKHLHWSS